MLPDSAYTFESPASRRWTRELTWLVILGSLLPAVCGAQQRTAGALAIVGGHLVDVQKGSEVDSSVVLTSGGRITAVGRTGEVQVPADAEVVDAHGKWVIPGLMDMHVHITNAAGGAPGNPFPVFYLANGVTTVRDTGGSITVLRLLKQDVESGRKMGPRLYFAGQVLDGNPPVGPNSRIMVDTEQRAVSAVNFLADQGASFIKVYNNISEAVLIATIKTARARGIPVIGHVPRVVTTTRAVELGMECLEHIRITGRELLPLDEANKIDFLTLGPRETALWQRYDLDSIGMNKVIQTIAQHHVFLDPTLTIDEETFKMPLAQRNAEPNNKMLPADVLARMLGRGLPESWLPPAGMEPVAAAGFDKRMKFIKMCYQAGVRITTGTDGPGLGPTLPGYGLHSEIELLEEAGLPPAAALRAATITAAQALHVDKDLGTIERGKFADLVMVDADPLLNVANARRIYRVVKGGRVYDPKELLAQSSK